MKKEKRNFHDNNREKILNFFSQKWGYLIFFILFTILIIIFRIGLMPFREMNGDTYWFLSPWTIFYRDNGGLKAIGKLPMSYMTLSGKQYPYGSSDFANNINNPNATIKYCDYLPGYLNLLVLFSYLPINSYLVCKVIGIMVDISLAIGLMFIAYKISNKNKLISLLTYIVFLILPTIFTNSGIWGQCDGLYACLIVWSIYFIITDRPHFSMMFLGFAFGSKLQTIFIVPLFGYLWLKKRFKLYWLLLIPVAMFIIFLPSIIGGMSLKTIINQYLGQAGEYKNANYNSGSFYVVFTKYNSSTNLRECVDSFGIPLCFIMLVGVLVTLFFTKVKATDINVIGVAALFSVVFPFFMPHMHERYFYLADVLIFLYVMLRKKNYWLIITSQLASFLAYTNFLFGDFILPKATFGELTLFICMLLNITSISTILFDLIKNGEKDTPINKIEIAK